MEDYSKTFVLESKIELLRRENSILDTKMNLIESTRKEHIEEMRRLYNIQLYVFIANMALAVLNVVMMLGLN